MDNLTALVSCFARAYHSKTARACVFDDTAAERVLGEDYERIAQSMTTGAGFFFPGLELTPEEGLRMIVDRQLAPSVLGRSALCEWLLKETGCEQYIIFASGYDTYAVRNSAEKTQIFELDVPEMISDKQSRLDMCGLKSGAAYVPCDLAEDTWSEKLVGAGYRSDTAAFASLLGISYYLEKEEFAKLIRTLGGIMCADSVICFDYPHTVGGRETKVNEMLAHAAGETMRARYGADEMEALMRECGFEPLESIDADKMNERFFKAHNDFEPEHEMHAPEGVGYIAAVKPRK